MSDRIKTKAQKKRERNAAKYKQFVGNKVEGQGFADRRKIKIMHDYNKIKRKEIETVKKGNYALKIYQTEDSSTGKNENSKTMSKVSRYHKAQMTAMQKKEETERQQKLKQEKQKAQKEALVEYQKKKKSKHKKLAVRNYKGQPNMASQMEVLLEKIKHQRTK